MNNLPAERTQVDGAQEAYSLLAATDCSVLPDLARQEYKRESDVNHLLERFGVGAVLDQKRQVSYGEADYDLDLHSGFIAVEAAQLAWHRLPAELKAKYRTPQAMLDAANGEEFRKDLKAHERAVAEARDNDQEDAQKARRAKREQEAREEAALAAARLPQPPEPPK